MNPDFNYTEAALKSRPRGLANLMSSTSGGSRTWKPEELAAIFRHQLSAPVLFDLGAFGAAEARNLKCLSDAQNLLLKNFSSLFQHPLPPLELLEAAKDFAKANINHPESCLPSEVATALYFTSIGVGLIRLGQKISQLPDKELKRGFEWIRAQPWIDIETKAIATKAIGVLEKPTATNTFSEKS